MKEGMGSALLKKPELVCEMVHAAIECVGASIPISIKVRILPDLK